MSQVYKKFIKFGTGTNDVNSRDVPANFTPSTYTPAQVASEGTDKVSAHLKGLDNYLASTNPTGDIAQTSFTFVDNQAAAANVTGLAFATGTVRSFRVQLSIVRGSTYQVFSMLGIQKGASFEMVQEYVGDDCGLVFSITSAGQVQYTSSSTGSGGTVKFRATVTSV